MTRVYPWIWRHLPGSWPVRSIVSVLLLAAVVGALMLYVFPWAEAALPFLRVTVQE